MWGTHTTLHLTGPKAIEMERRDFLGDPGGVSGVREGHGGLHKGRGIQVWCHPQTRKGAGPQHRCPNCAKDTGFLTLDVFVFQERGAAEETPAAISQEAPRSAAAELEGEAGARPLPEGWSLLGPLFNRLASVPVCGRKPLTFFPDQCDHLFFRCHFSWCL